MPLPGNAEPGAISGQQQQVQQQQSFSLLNAIPIKKRRFPVFRPASPPPEELPAVSELHDSKDKQESNVPSSDAINTASPGNSDVSKTSGSIIKKEVATTDTELGQSNVDIFASKPNEANPSVSLGPQDDLRSKTDVFSKPKVSENLGAQTKVKQEIVGGQTEVTGTLDRSTGLMNVDLSLGPKDATVPAFIHEKTSEAVCNKSDQSDPSMLSLSFSEEKLVLNDNNGSKTEATVAPVCSNRSNWDLNTTMDVWEGSTAKTNSFHNEKSSLTTASNTVGLSLNKRKNILDDHSSNSSNAFIQTNKQYKTDNSLGLGLAMAYRELDTLGKHTSLSDNFVSASVTSKSNLQPVVSTVNVNRPVKSEPVDENSKRDCSVGSCNSSNMGLLKLSSVKQEFVNNLSVLQSSIPTKKLVDCGSIKSELAQEDNQEARKRVMQHQDSCASSPALSVPTCSELTISRDLSNQSEHYFNRKGLMPCKVGSSSVLDPEKCKLARVDEETIESSECSVVAKQDEEKINIPAEMLEKVFFDSDCESKKKCAFDGSIDEGGNICDKQDEEYEDGEVREPIKYSAGEDPIVDGKKTESSVLSVDRNMNVSNFDGKDSTTENHGKTRDTPNKDSVSVNYEPYEPNGESNSLQKLSDKNLLNVRNDEKRSICVTPDKLLDLSGREYVEEYPGKEVSTERPIDGSHGIGAEVGEEGSDKVARETCSRENDLMVEASFGDDAAKDSNNISNRSRIINLARASAVTSPGRTRSFPNRFLPSRSGKERCSDPDGEMQPRGNRNEFYNGGSNKFQKDRFYDHQSFRNSKPNFMRGRGRMSGRFNSVRNEWNSDHDFGSETSYGQSDYHAARRKHASDIDQDCNDYRSPQDGASNNRRKTLNNDEFPSVRRTSLRRVSPGDRDGPMTRGNMQMVRRFPRNTSPCSDVMGPRHMRHLSDDVIDPVYSRSQPNTYDESDGQMVRGNRNFSNVPRKGYNTRIRSKSPDRSRTRSPGIWSSPRRRSPNGVQELTQHRSPAMYRMGRMRSPDRSCFRDEMVDRRRCGSPPYVAESSGRPANSNRRGSPGRVFPRSGRRADSLVEDGDEYMNGGPLHSNKFHGNGNIDERRKFVDRRGGPMRSFRQNYNNDGDSFRFHMNDGPTRPFRFCPDQDSEFVERGNVREREFDGNVKHQPLVVNRRNRNIEEQQEGNYRPVERVWHDDEFTDDRMKRRRY